MGTGGTATTESDGTYDLGQAIRVGEYTVYLSRIVESDGPVSTAQERLSVAPPEYSNEMTSPLKVNVEEGDNTINLDVPKA